MAGEVADACRILRHAGKQGLSRRLGFVEESVERGERGERRGSGSSASGGKRVCVGAEKGNGDLRESVLAGRRLRRHSDPGACARDDACSDVSRVAGGGVSSSSRASRVGGADGEAESGRSCEDRSVGFDVRELIEKQRACVDAAHVREERASDAREGTPKSVSKSAQEPRNVRASSAQGAKKLLQNVSVQPAAAAAAPPRPPRLVGCHVWNAKHAARMAACDAGTSAWTTARHEHEPDFETYKLKRVRRAGAMDGEASVSLSMYEEELGGMGTGDTSACMSREDMRPPRASVAPRGDSCAEDTCTARLRDAVGLAGEKIRGENGRLRVGSSGRPSTDRLRASVGLGTCGERVCVRVNEVDGREACVEGRGGEKGSVGETETACAAKLRAGGIGDNRKRVADGETAPADVRARRREYLRADAEVTRTTTSGVRVATEHSTKLRADVAAGPVATELVNCGTGAVAEKKSKQAGVRGDAELSPGTARHLTEAVGQDGRETRRDVSHRACDEAKIRVQTKTQCESLRDVGHVPRAAERVEDAASAAERVARDILIDAVVPRMEVLASCVQAAIAMPVGSVPKRRISSAHDPPSAETISARDVRNGSVDTRVHRGTLAGIGGILRNVSIAPHMREISGTKCHRGDWQGASLLSRHKTHLHTLKRRLLGWRSRDGAVPGLEAANAQSRSETINLTAGPHQSTHARPDRAADIRPVSGDPPASDTQADTCAAATQPADMHATSVHVSPSSRALIPLSRTVRPQLSSSSRRPCPPPARRRFPLRIILSPVARALMRTLFPRIPRPARYDLRVDPRPRCMVASVRALRVKSLCWTAGAHEKVKRGVVDMGGRGVVKVRRGRTGAFRSVLHFGARRSPRRDCVEGDDPASMDAARGSVAHSEDLVRTLDVRGDGEPRSEPVLQAESTHLNTSEEPRQPAHVPTAPEICARTVAVAAPWQQDIQLDTNGNVLGKNVQTELDSPCAITQLAAASPDPQTRSETGTDTGKVVLAGGVDRLVHGVVATCELQLAPLLHALAARVDAASARQREVLDAVSTAAASVDDVAVDTTGYVGGEKKFGEIGAGKDMVARELAGLQEDVKRYVEVREKDVADCVEFVRHGLTDFVAGCVEGAARDAVRVLESVEE